MALFNQIIGQSTRTLILTLLVVCGLIIFLTLVSCNSEEEEELKAKIQEFSQEFDKFSKALDLLSKLDKKRKEAEAEMAKAQMELDQLEKDNKVLGKKIEGFDPNDDFTDQMKLGLLATLDGLNEKEILTYGDQCLPKIEKRRYELLESFVTTNLEWKSNSQSFNEHKLQLQSILVELYETMVEDPEVEFCRKGHLLMCSVVSETCDCFSGDDTIRFGLPFRIELERDNGTGATGACVIPNHQPCPPPDYNSTAMIRFTASKTESLIEDFEKPLVCHSNSICVINDGRNTVCNTKNLWKHLGLDTKDIQTIYPSIEEIFLDNYCSCKIKDSVNNKDEL